MWGCNENVSGGAGMTNAISVKDRLKKQAIEDEKTMQDKLATKLYPLLPTTPGTANLTNFPKRKTPQSATLQSLYINKNERTLFPRFVVVGFLYSFGSSRQDFQIFFAHTVKHGIELTAARGFLLFPFREKELVY